MTKTRTCKAADCSKKYHAKGYCYAHYMRLWRYGDAEFKHAYKGVNIAGKRFGSLVAVEVGGVGWKCDCDCGAKTVVRVGDLNSGSVKTCGDMSVHWRLPVVRYYTAHQRLASDRGKASGYRCIDCGEWAAQWSYDHADPDGLMDGDLPYSLKSSHYDPRCVPCHKLFDLNR